MAKDKVQFTLGFGGATDATGGLSPTDMAELASQLADRGYIEPGLVDTPDDITDSFADFTMQVAPVVTPAIMGFAGAWVQAKFGRKVRLKTDKYEVEANTAEEVILLVDLFRSGERGETT